MATAASSARDRLTAAIGVGVLHALLAYMLISGLAVNVVRKASHELKVFDIRTPPKPQRIVPHPRQSRARSGAAAPRGQKAKPTEVTRPPPVILIPQPPPILSVPSPGVGAEARSGASPLPGPGSGSGGYGSGEGGGFPPRHIGGRIRDSDYPSALGVAGIGGTVSVRYTVTIAGRARNCRATRSSGQPELDAATCRLIEERFRFRPARDGDGRPVVSDIVEDHSWIAK